MVVKPCRVTSCRKSSVGSGVRPKNGSAFGVMWTLDPHSGRCIVAFPALPFIVVPMGFLSWFFQYCCWLLRFTQFHVLHDMRAQNSLQYALPGVSSLATWFRAARDVDVRRSTGMSFANTPRISVCICARVGKRNGVGEGVWVGKG